MRWRFKDFRSAGTPDVPSETFSFTVQPQVNINDTKQAPPGHNSEFFHVKFLGSLTPILRNAIRRCKALISRLCSQCAVSLCSYNAAPRCLLGVWLWLPSSSRLFTPTHPFPQPPFHSWEQIPNYRNRMEKQKQLASKSRCTEVGHGHSFG